MAQVALPAPQARGVAYRVLIGPIAVALRSYAFPFFHACIWSFDPPTTYVEKPISIETAFVWNLSLVSSATSLLIVVIDSTESKSKFYLDTMEQMLVRSGADRTITLRKPAERLLLRRRAACVQLVDVAGVWQLGREATSTAIPAHNEDERGAVRHSGCSGLCIIPLTSAHQGYYSPALLPARMLIYLPVAANRLLRCGFSCSCGGAIGFSYGFARERPGKRPG